MAIPLAREIEATIQDRSWVWLTDVAKAIAKEMSRRVRSWR